MKPALITIATLALSACATIPPAFDAYAGPGPYAVVSAEEGPDCTVFRPENLGQGGRLHPVILWGNGTRSRVPAYTPMLSHWASHGFVVAAANTNNAGPGTPLLDCLNFVVSEAPYARYVDISQVGTSGHSQGGGGAIMAGRDARITTTAPIQPYIRGLGYEPGAEGDQFGPMLLLSGGADTTAGPETDQRPVFENANVPVFWAILEGSPHSDPATGDNGAYRVITTAWFRWRLMGDETAGRWFENSCAICRTENWTVRRSSGL
jgi:hypothetical protein